MSPSVPPRALPVPDTVLLRAAILARKVLAGAVEQGTWVVDDAGVLFATERLDDPARCDQHPAGVPNDCDDHRIALLDDDHPTYRATAAHIVANQPSEVIRQCEADLRIVEHCEMFTGREDDQLAWHAARLSARVLADLAEAYGVTEEA